MGNLLDFSGGDLAINLHGLDSRILLKLKEKNIKFSSLEKVINLLRAKKNSPKIYKPLFLIKFTPKRIYFRKES